MTQAVEQSETETTKSFGILAEFKDVSALMTAAEKIRDLKQYTKWDCYTPFPVHGLDDAMGTKPTRLPWLTFFAGASGTSAGLILESYTGATTHGWVPESMQGTMVGQLIMTITQYIPAWAQGYPTIISGKPYLSIPANVPIAFETTILFAAIGTVVGLFAFNALPRLYHPLFKKRSFRRVTSDGFFIAIEAIDPAYDEAGIKALFEELGALSVERVEE